mmetsp:Transcript_20316/g.78026  ORF Transcript_20316/g.78026 Transcript_20316/m.78026 type:complete len:230 (+) Transcript_20316:2056-2745(+)
MRSPGPRPTPKPVKMPPPRRDSGIRGLPSLLLPGCRNLRPQRGRCRRRLRRRRQSRQGGRTASAWRGAMARLGLPPRALGRFPTQTPRWQLLRRPRPARARPRCCGERAYPRCLRHLRRRRATQRTDEAGYQRRLGSRARTLRQTRRRHRPPALGSHCWSWGSGAAARYRSSWIPPTAGAAWQEWCRPGGRRPRGLARCRPRRPIRLQPRRRPPPRPPLPCGPWQSPTG